MTRLRTLFVLAAVAGADVPRPSRRPGLLPRGSPPAHEGRRRLRGQDSSPAEPDVRQPVTITFDDRGRMWVIQYLQYPTPAGLKPVKVDQYLRTVYDRVPEPPPKGPKGADRITILVRPRRGRPLPQGEGLRHRPEPGLRHVPRPRRRLRRAAARTCSSIPIKRRRRRAGRRPGSAARAASAWRTPTPSPTRCSGGRTAGCTAPRAAPSPPTSAASSSSRASGAIIPSRRSSSCSPKAAATPGASTSTRHGNVIAGTNWGGFAMLHQVQGGYYIKGFGKHGPLHNPHTYGYFDHVPYKDFKGGHVTCGGIVYQGGAFPGSIEDSYIAGNLLSNALYWHTLERKGSTLHQPAAAAISWSPTTPGFRPIDCLTGPDGAVYVADWYDKRANHVDPVDNWDQTQRPHLQDRRRKGAKPASGSSTRRSASGPARSWSRCSTTPTTGIARGPAHPGGAARRRRHPRPRKKTILDEQGPAGPGIAVGAVRQRRLRRRLRREAVRPPQRGRAHLDGASARRRARRSVPASATGWSRWRGRRRVATVRSQLACSAKRLPGQDCLPIVRELLRHDEDVDDPHIPLLLWWAVEDKAIRDRDTVLGLLDTPEAWQVPLVSRFIVERLARRYMAEGGEADLKRLRPSAGGGAGTGGDGPAGAADGKGAGGPPAGKVPAVLEKQLIDLWTKRPDDLTLLRLAVRWAARGLRAGPEAQPATPKAPDADRINLIEVLGQTGKPECVPVLLRVAGRGQVRRRARGRPGGAAAVPRSAHHGGGAGALSEAVGRPARAGRRACCAAGRRRAWRSSRRWTPAGSPEGSAARPAAARWPATRTSGSTSSSRSTGARSARDGRREADAASATSAALLSKAAGRPRQRQGALHEDTAPPATPCSARATRSAPT